jgi:diacylglycerol O-acyltransferase
MPRYAYERLSAQDNTFLLMERSNVYMHVAATSVYESGPLVGPDGAFDIAAFRRAVEGFIHIIPRYREKLKWIPYAEAPVWVDDRYFNLDFHVRHTALPRPGSDAQLKKLAGRLMSQKLDRDRPLWEFWVVEGLEGGRFALISKIHHCMIDGSAGADLATILMSLTPEQELPEIHPYVPRPAPTGRELVQDELKRMMNLPAAIVRGLYDFGKHTEGIRGELFKRTSALVELFGYAIKKASDTPLNGRLGPHRTFDWLGMSLEEVKAVRRHFGCTVNDLVLATVAGAVRSYLIRRRVDPTEIDFRVSAPVSVRRDEDRGKLGNHVSSWIVRLPIQEKDAVRRLESIHRVTDELKRSEQALGVQMLMAAAEWAPAQLLSLGSRSATGPINMIVTNVPGPQIPLYMLGSRLVEMYPQVPLLANTGLGVALFSYNGRMCWGFNADPGVVPDIAEFVRMVRNSFDELASAAGVDLTGDLRVRVAGDAASTAGTGAAGDARDVSSVDTEEVSDEGIDGDADRAELPGNGRPRA